MAVRQRASADTLRLVASGTVLLALVALNVAAGRGSTGVGGGESGPTAGAGFADWTVRRGHALFLAKGCAGCHTLRGMGGEGPPIGPDLTPLPQVARARRVGVSAEEYVRESIVAPDAFLAPGLTAAGGTRMPRIDLSDADVQALVAFLLAPREAR